MELIEGKGEINSIHLPHNANLTRETLYLFKLKAFVMNNLNETLSRVGFFISFIYLFFFIYLDSFNKKIQNIPEKPENATYYDHLLFPTVCPPSPVAQSVACRTREQEVADSIRGSVNILSEDR